MLHLGSDVTLLNQAFMLLLEHAHITSHWAFRGPPEIGISGPLPTSWSDGPQLWRSPQGSDLRSTEKQKVCRLSGHPGVSLEWVLGAGSLRLTRQLVDRGLLVVVVGHRTARIRGTSASSPRGGKWCYNDKSK
jgi:hypothetical protein